MRRGEWVRKVLPGLEAAPFFLVPAPAGLTSGPLALDAGPLPSGPLRAAVGTSLPFSLIVPGSEASAAAADPVTHGAGAAPYGPLRAALHSS